MNENIVNRYHFPMRENSVVINSEISDEFTLQIIKNIIEMIFNSKDVGIAFDEFGCCELLYIVVIFQVYINERYDKAHFAQRLKGYYSKWNVAVAGHVPIIEDNRLLQGEISGARKGRRDVKTGINKESLICKCRLIRDLLNDSALECNELLLIVSNFVNMQNGTKMLRFTINENNSLGMNWDIIFKAMADFGVAPVCCDECRYSSECSHGRNILATVKPSYHDITVVEKRNYCTITEAEKSLRDNFNAVLKSRDEIIKIIIAQTGLGKTNTYINAIMNSDDLFMIVVPTHKLKDEIYQKAIRMGITNIIATPQMPELSDKLQSKIAHYYDIGVGQIAIKEMRKMLNFLDESDSDYINIKEYIEAVDSVKKFNGHIITTHQRFMFYTDSSEVLDTHRIIIDEDILDTLLPIKLVSNADILKAMRCDSIRKYPAAYERLRYIYTARELHKISSPINTYVNEDLVNELEYEGVNSDIIDLLASSVIENDGSFTRYLKIRELPDKEIIIMSATIEPDLYRAFFPNRIIKEYRCKDAEYMGKVIQYTDETYSRSSFKNKPELIENIKGQIDDYEVITFSMIQREFNTDYHFGGIDGLNCLEGKNIAVIGTPNVDDIVYKMMGMYLEIDIREMRMENLRVTHNGYEFTMYTYRNNVMRMIQMWKIESNLEQAVGRARLLRNDCTVKVFSCFPVSQARLW